MCATDVVTRLRNPSPTSTIPDARVECTTSDCRGESARGERAQYQGSSVCSCQSGNALTQREPTSSITVSTGAVRVLRSASYSEWDTRERNTSQSKRDANVTPAFWIPFVVSNADRMSSPRGGDSTYFWWVICLFLTGAYSQMQIKRVSADEINNIREGESFLESVARVKPLDPGLRMCRKFYYKMID